jgi:uncharacterized protein (DUF302 family)
MSQDGLVTIPSIHTVRETIDRFAEAADAAGLRIFGRVDHAAGAAEVEMPLRPTELIIFGHPRSGTPLMQDQQTAGIDLPLKALAWEDGEGNVWLTYNDAGWLARRHGLGSDSEPSIEAIGGATAKLAAAATT